MGAQKKIPGSVFADIILAEGLFGRTVGSNFRNFVRQGPKFRNFGQRLGPTSETSADGGLSVLLDRDFLDVSAKSGP